MSFWSRNVIALIATSAVLLSTLFSLHSAIAAEPLSVVGPNGQVNNVVKQYGPTESFDTLWSIAQKVKPDQSLSTYQVMAALYDSNPQAFSGSSYSSLEKGVVLVIPDQKMIAQYPKTAAVDNKTSTQKSVSTIKSAASKSAPMATLKKMAEKSTQADLLSVQLQEAQTRNKRLSDDVVKAQDALVLSTSDNQELKTNIAELNVTVGLLNDKLQASLIQNAKQKQTLEAAEEQVSTLIAIEMDLRTQSQAVQAPTFWQSIMARPWLLAGFTVVPAFLLIIAIWAWFRRRTKTDVPPNDDLTSARAVARDPEPEGGLDEGTEARTEEDKLLEKSDDQDSDRAVQLDGRAPAASFEALQNEHTDDYLDSLELTTEADSSIDELWAEVIEEHDDANASEALNDEQEGVMDTAENESHAMQEAASPDDLSQTNLNADSYDEPRVSALNDAFTQTQMDNTLVEEVDNIPFGSAHPGDDSVETIFDEKEAIGRDYEPENAEIQEEQSDNITSLHTDEVEDVFIAKADTTEPLGASEHDYSLEKNLSADDADFMLSSSVADNIAAALADDLPHVDKNNINSDDELESLLAEFDNVAPITVDGGLDTPYADDRPLDAIDGLSVNVPDEIAEVNAEQQEAMEESISDIDALLAELEDEVVIVDPQVVGGHNSGKPFEPNKTDSTGTVLGSKTVSQQGDEAQEALLNAELDQFQQDNSFIDINSLLNDEPEDSKGRVDPYFESNIEIDELENLMDTASHTDNSEQNMSAKLDLARAYMEIDDKESARTLLKEVGLDGNERERREAGALLNELVGL
ncbi:FimV/HubP family polar landmark protein [Shewanella surugensis]|uniref:Pilus assembly protein FimV n=1 Tax=Shewanella surugensis TaxID=212020 RepID=A0ABT0LID5_9GAMM|nr:FimV/HubP family polar landmark protein [Shewanella surugensis]MCL1127463.1 hypothetical protein [Shewanella surugensis]